MIDYFEDKKIIIMEFAENGTLHDYLMKQNSPIGMLKNPNAFNLTRLEFETYMEYSINRRNSLFAQ